VNSKTLFEKTRAILGELASFLNIEMEPRNNANSVNQNSTRETIQIREKAREIAEKSLEGVAKGVEEIVSEEMIIGKDLLHPSKRIFPRR
jgi:hypothetical protein